MLTTGRGIIPGHFFPVLIDSRRVRGDWISSEDGRSQSLE
jgi:hypothetical protein